MISIQLLRRLHTGAPDPSPTSVRAARGQIAGGLARSPTFASVATRRELGEELKISFVTIHTGWQAAPAIRGELGKELKLLFVTLHAGWQSARREGNLKQYSDGVNGMFRKFTGNNLRNMHLTDRGFVRG